MKERGGLCFVRTFTPLIKNPENWLLVFLGALATYFFVKTFSYRSGAALFPRIVSFVVAILCSWHFFENILKALKNPLREEDTEAATICLSWYGSLALILLYFLLIYITGFVLATGLFMIFFPVAAGYRRWPVIIITALVTAVLIDLSFNRFLEIQLHEGILFTLFQ